MNKDKSNERVKRYRERQKTVTPSLVETVTQNKALHEKPLQKDTVTLYRYIDGKRVDLEKVPAGFKVLSDGQVWEPSLIIPVIPERRTRDEIDKVTAAKLLLICTSLNKRDLAQYVRYGVKGPTMDVVSETLGAS